MTEMIAFAIIDTNTDTVLTRVLAKNKREAVALGRSRVTARPMTVAEIIAATNDGKAIEGAETVAERTFREIVEN